MSRVGEIITLDDGSWCPVWDDGTPVPGTVLYAEQPAQGEAVAEEWRPVPSFEDEYLVSESGQIKNRRTGKILTSKALAGAGYVKADLWRNGERTQTYVHRVVAEAFLKPSDGDEVNHKNGIKTDNRASNLEWCSRSRNTLHSYYELGNNVHSVVAICDSTGETRSFASVELAVRDGFDSAHIYRCLKEPHRVHKGFRWTSGRTAPPAPCVPDAMEDDDPIMSGYAEGWNACRDAMLASGGKANVPDAVSKDAARYRYLRTVLRPNQFVFMPTHKSDEIALKNDAAVDGTMARLAAPEPPR